ncbi:MAG: hypothetical protein PHT39_04785 [Sphaerochaetaceae bacterium]|nr:hypothetical protein [Sphaerochaetaceae bacterium]MDD4396873.1 hypothetical protein [Sphaerochaetaceae bacterium]
MKIVDFRVSYGFSPKKVIKADLDYVLQLLERTGVTCALLHSLKGMHYDPMEGNNDCVEACRTRSTDSLRLIPVGTFNPLEGIERCSEVIQKGLNSGIRFWRLYPKEQNWTSDHPVFKLLIPVLSSNRCIIAIDSTPAEIERIAILAGSDCPVVTSLHYYDSADWCLRLSELKNVFPTARLLHGPGSFSYAMKYFPGRIVFESDAPFGAPSSVIGLINPQHLDDVCLRNADALLRRLGFDC